MTGTLGAMYRVQKKHELSKQKFKESLPFFKKIEDTRSVVSSTYQLAQVESMQGNHKTALPLLEEALALYDELGPVLYRKEINQQLYITHSILGQQAKADDPNVLYNAAKDSNNSREDKKRIVEMQIKYETEK
jgi:tetratricopeptide (TPR) repeat protein